MDAEETQQINILAAPSPTAAAQPPIPSKKSPTLSEKREVFQGRKHRGTPLAKETTAEGKRNGGPTPELQPCDLTEEFYAVDIWEPRTPFPTFPPGIHEPEIEEPVPFLN